MSNGINSTVAEDMTHPDGNREIRSMVMAALPLPPLPLLVYRELQGELSFVDSDHQVTSSHDLIAHMMNIACAVASSSINNSRMERQSSLMGDLFSTLDDFLDKNAHLQVPDEKWCYEAAMHFTRLYIGTYLVRQDNDIRFLLDASAINESHRLHKMALEYQKAQDVLYGACMQPEKKLEDMSYLQLVQHSFRRMAEARPAGASALVEI